MMNTDGKASKAVVGEIVKPKRASPQRTVNTRVDPTKIQRLGKDELNLIEHPFAVLWQKEAIDAKIYYQWDAKHPVTGRVLPASWMVAGHRDYGLPNATDERVYLVLLELTREAGFEQQNVHFSRYDLLQRLGWDTGPKSYAMLERAFERLQGVTITAKNAFWNPKTGSFVNTGFNIIDHYSIESERPGRKSIAQPELPVSFWRWSDVLFASFQSGYLRTLDLDFALALKSDIALRLYRYLDKKSYDGRSSFEIDLFNLCQSHLGMKPSAYPSKLKERLKPAHDELMAKGFLESVEYKPMKTKKGVKVCYHFASRSLHPAKAAEPTSPEPPHGEAAPLLLIAPGVDAAGTEELPGQDGSLSHEKEELLAQMTKIKISPEVAQSLLETVPAAHLRLQLDCLADREPRDHAATFVKAVRESWEAPAKYLERQKTTQRAKKAQTNKEASRLRKAAQEAVAREEKASQEQESARLDALWESLDSPTRERLEAEAKQKLGVLGQSGRAQGALDATRRNLLREMLGQANN
jgi:hypothetical protein